MSERLGSTATGAEASSPGPRPDVPREVQASFLLWLTAVAAGVVETIIRLIYSLSAGPGSGGEVDLTSVLIRVIVYTVAIYIIAQMRLGKRWARITLAVLLGGIGEVFRQADLLFFVIAPIRAVHLGAVIAALVFMFLPAANAYFRRASSAAGAPGSPTVAPSNESARR